MKSGKLERLLEFTGEFTAQFAGATDSKVLFLVDYLDADLAPLSEYSSQNPDGDYAEYLDEMWSRHSVSELRLYDMDMSAYDGPYISRLALQGEPLIFLQKHTNSKPL